nr:hypothetical protein [Tanacetum cinerariifolium]
MMCTSVFVDPESSTQADGSQSSRLPVPLPKDPYEAIRQAYLVGTDTESEPFEGKARTPESSHIVAPLTCHVEELEGSVMSGARSTSSDSTMPLSPDCPLTHTTPALVPILRRTARMAVRVPPVMSPGLFAGIADVAAMSGLAFRKRFRSSYDSSPSPTLPVRKRYRGTSELILGTDSKKDEEIQECLDSDSESEDAEDEGPTTKDEDPVARDEGLAARVKGPIMDDESHGVDDESHGVDDESRGLKDGGYGIEIDGLGLEEEEEAVPGGQQQAALVVGTAVSTPSGLRYGALKCLELALEGDHVYSTFKTDPEDGMVYIDIPVYPPPTPPVQTPPSPEWTPGLLPISSSPSVVPLPILSPMIPYSTITYSFTYGYLDSHHPS